MDNDWLTKQMQDYPAALYRRWPEGKGELTEQLVECARSMLFDGWQDGKGNVDVPYDGVVQGYADAFDEGYRNASSHVNAAAYEALQDVPDQIGPCREWLEAHDYPGLEFGEAGFTPMGLAWVGYVRGVRKYFEDTGDVPTNVVMLNVGDSD